MLSAAGLIAGSRRSKSVVFTAEGEARARALLAEGRLLALRARAEPPAAIAPRARDPPAKGRRQRGPTTRQGQYLAYIHQYSRVHALPPSENEIALRFGVSGPSAHGMVLALEEAGFLGRTPGAPRSLRVLVPPEALPALEAPPDGWFLPTPARPARPSGQGGSPDHLSGR